jgi:hypothetical protein
MFVGVLKVARAKPVNTAVATVNSAVFAQCRSRAFAAKAETFVGEDHQGCGVGIESLALIEHLAIPSKTEMVKLCKNFVCSAGGFARWVNIFYAH